MKNNKKFFEGRIGGSFHYQNNLMDRYSWDLRRRIFFKHINVKNKKILDVGCGDGSWIHEFIKRGSLTPYGIEQSLKLAKNCKYGKVYGYGADSEKMNNLDKVNIVTAITSLNFIVKSKRKKVIENIYTVLKPNGIVVVLDYLPDTVPNYQKDLTYKEVWTKDQWIDLFENSNFKLSKIVPVNWVDTTLFHYFGSNYLIYLITYLLDTYLTFLIPKSKYKLLIFRKL